MNEHKKIELLSITEDLGLIILFDDGCHTYIEPEDFYEIWTGYLNLAIEKVEKLYEDE